MAKIDGLIKDYYPNGTYTVGKDIPAGEYVLISSVPLFDIFNHFGGTPSFALSSDLSEQSTEFSKSSIVTISNGQTLELKNCRALDISLVTDELSPTPSNNNGFGPGTYRVGIDIHPGKYEIYNSNHIEYLQIYKDSTHKNDSKVNSISNGTFELKEGEYLFHNGRYNTFSLVND